LTALRDGKILLETLRDLLPDGTRKLDPLPWRLRAELHSQRLAERRRLRPPILLHSAAMLREVRLTGRREKLQRRAFRLGARLFAGRPRRYR
jgi:hypothetical protein